MAYYNEVSVSNPAAQGLVKAAKADPVLVFAVHNGIFEDGPGKEYRYQEHGTCRVKKGDGPETEQFEEIGK